MLSRASALVGVCLLTLLGACGGRTYALPARTSASPPAHPAQPAAHVAVVVMENEDYPAVIGSRSAPFINRLARSYSSATAMYSITHPSLPNYLALTGGSTFGIDSDCTDCSVKATGLANQLQQAGISWKAYMEGLPRPCFTGAGAGEYAKKHDPFVYYTSIAHSQAACGHVVPLAQLYSDEHAHALPRFVWITPNLCHDMHDCSVATGDRFLARLVPRLLSALGSGGLLILTWDEDNTNDGCCRLAAGGHVPAILAGGLARRHAVLRTPTDLYSVLQLVDDLLGLRRMRAAACSCTTSLAPLLRTASRSRTSG